MFRLTARSIAASTSRRSISSTAPTWVRVRSANPATPPKAPASPAERPPAPPPDSSTTPPPFEPEVSRAGALPESISSAQTAESLSSSTTPSAGPQDVPLNTPIENPSPAELESAQDAIPEKPDFSQLPSLDIDPDVALPEPETEGDKDGKRTGAKEREYVSSMERTRKAYIRFLLAAMGVGSIAGVVYLGQGEEGDGKGSWWDRVTGNTSEMLDIFNKPAFSKLLPDPLPPTHQRPYTLLVDLDGMLVSSTWDRAHGWRTVKRPGVDYFLSYLSQFYEIVLFTSQPTYTAIPVAEKLDPVGAFMPYKLFRDATRFHNGKVVKDLSYLNRDLSKVVMLETDVEHGALQPENTVGMKMWDGKAGDRGLVDMIPFLESIAMFNVKDVRPIVKAYQGKDIPIEYAKKEAEAKRVAIEEWERRNPGGAAGGGGAGWLGGLFGGVAPNTSKANQPMTFLDQKRAEAQKAYQLEQKYYKEHEEEYKRMIEEDKAKQMAEMKGSLMGMFGGGSSKAA